MTMIMPQFGALYKTYLEEEAFDNVKTKLIESANDKLTRRDDEGDWVYKGGDLAELMGVENTCFEASATNFSETLAFITLDEKSNAVNIETDHPEHAKNTDKAVVLRGAMTELFESDIVEKIREEWKAIGRNWETVFYLGGIPADLDDELKEEPNMMKHFSGATRVPAVYNILRDNDIETFNMLLKHPKFEPHKETTDGYLPMICFEPSSDARVTMVIELINHPKTTLRDLNFADKKGKNVEQHFKSKGMPSVVLDAFYAKIRELRGSV